jgi:transposase
MVIPDTLEVISPREGIVRGANQEQDPVFSYVSPADRVPKDHPLRIIKEMTSHILKDLSRDFTRMYSPNGRPSIPPEKLIRALLLQVLYSIRSERLLMEQLNYNLLFRWFVGLSMDDEVWDHSTFSKNRERLLEADIIEKFFVHVREEARRKGLLSDEHFTVDGTLIEAWASQKSFKPKDGGSSKSGGSEEGRNEDVDYRGQRRSNETHGSTTDADARLAKKSRGTEARLSFQGHVLMENRNGLVVDARLSICSGTAEREAAIDMLGDLREGGRITVGLDKGYDSTACVEGLRELNVTPHVARRSVGSAIDGRTVRHAGYQISQRVRKRVEEIFGWMKTVGVYRKTRFRGVPRVGWGFMLAMVGYNLVRIKNLTLQEAPI